MSAPDPRMELALAMQAEFHDARLVELGVSLADGTAELRFERFPVYFRIGDSKYELRGFSLVVVAHSLRRLELSELPSETWVIDGSIISAGSPCDAFDLLRRALPEVELRLEFCTGARLALAAGELDLASATPNGYVEPWRFDEPP